MYYTRPGEVDIGTDLNIVSIKYISSDISTSATPIIQFKDYIPRYFYNYNSYSINYADIFPLTNTDIMLQKKCQLSK